MDFSKFRYFSFDCYGTLIDWERGILDAMLPFLAGKGIEADPADVLENYGRFEPAAEQGEFRIYKDVLRAVMAAFARHHGFQLQQGEADLLLSSLPDWPPFPDTVEALRKLGERFKLVIISNIDEDLIQGTLKQLDVRFHAIVTAEQVRSYKPDIRNFEQALARIGAGKEEVCHVAQSLYHDIAPARALGIHSIWVNRRKGKAGAGATPQSSVRPHLELDNLAALAEMVCVE